MPRLLRSLSPLIVVAVVALQFAPVLGGRVYRFEDIASYFEPLWAAAARAMREGRWPIWEQGAWSGQALAGDPQAGVFYPPNWLWLVLPPLRAYAVVVALHALLAGLGMYVLARLRGASRAGAALAGVALGAGGYVVLQVRHVVFVEATAWMPWVLAAGWRLMGERGRGPALRWLVPAAAAIGMLLLTGGVSMIYYGAWFAAAVLIPRALRDRAASQQKLRCIAAGLAAVALGVLLAAPALIPALAHGRLSPRALGADAAFAGSVAWGGLYYLPSLFVPNLLGQQVRGDYLGGGTQWEIAGYYTGIATFALALHALTGGTRERRSERIALAAVLVLCVLLAPGERSPLHALACRILPLYSTMRCPPRALYVVALAMPMLAADGLDRLRARFAQARPAWRGLLACAPLIVAVDLLLTHRHENPSTTPAAAHREATPDVVPFLRAHLRPGERFVNDVHLRHDLHNAGLLWDLPGAGGYSSLPLWRYLHLLWISNHGRVYPHPRLHDDLSAQGLWRFESPIVDLLAVRFVLAPRGWQPSTGYRLAFEGGDGIDAWENTEAGPPAFFVAAGDVDDGPLDAAAWMAAVAARSTPPARHAVERAVDRATAPAGPAATARTPDATARAPDATARAPDATALAPHAAALLESTGATLRHLSPTVREIDFVAPTAGELVVAEPAHPGWRALVDGQPAPVDTVDLALIGVPVGPGRHRVQLRMTALPVNAGLIAGAVTWSCVAAAGLVIAGRRRRARVERPAALPAES